MNDKKIRELEDLRRAYPVDDFPIVTPSEMPDFILEKSNSRFGVEITDYYQDDTGGRFANVPEYSKPAEDQSSIHPLDVGVIEVVSPEIEDKKGVWMSFGPAYYRPILSANERITKLLMIIDAKHRKFSHYNATLDYIDLLIIDRGDLFAGTEGTAIEQALKEFQSNNANLTSLFKNIYVQQTAGPFKKIKIWNQGYTNK